MEKASVIFRPTYATTALFYSKQKIITLLFSKNIKKTSKKLSNINYCSLLFWTPGIFQKKSISAISWTHGNLQSFRKKALQMWRSLQYLTLYYSAVAWQILMILIFQQQILLSSDYSHAEEILIITFSHQWRVVANSILNWVLKLNLIYELFFFLFM